MPGNRRVVLVGPMAVGKSAVGRTLARRTDARFVDTDRVIAERHGSIPAIFARGGEQAFRALEAEVVGEALAADGVVVSLGGGAVLHPGTRALLADAVVVFLDTDLATVLPRIRADTGRPLLAGRPAERWQELYDARRPVYAAVATAVVDTRGLTVAAAADAVLRALAGNDTQNSSPNDPPNDILNDTPNDTPNDESGTDPHGD